MPLHEKIRLGDILVQQKLLTQDPLVLCLSEQKRYGRKIGQTFVGHGFVAEEDISLALGK